MARRHFTCQWVDPGLARAVKNQVRPVAIEERGALFEGWVLALLHAYDGVHGLFDDIRYWASANVEVDFLLQRGREFVALEAKAAPRTAPEHFSGLRSIRDLPGVVRRVLVHPGRHERPTDDGIEIWPVEVLVEHLASNRLWP